MTTAGAATRADCRNCGARAATAALYCGHCGQALRLHPPTLREFVHEFAAHYVALEGALWRTLAALLWHPGRLTAEYLAGRRRHYVLPLRLYLSTSFVFFLVVKGLGAVALPWSTGLDADAPARALTPAQLEGARELRRCLEPAAGCGWFDTRAARLLADAQSGVPVGRQIEERLVARAPYAMFLLVPAYAGFLALAWRRRRQPYGVHFVYSLHLHSFWFVALLALVWLPAGAREAAVLPMFAYSVLAMRRVYGGGWPGLVARELLVDVLYLATMAACTLGLTLLALGG